MLIELLKIDDFGTYQGRQTFDLAPRIKYGNKRPIILFGGLNGSGKTTFLNAVRLALYGRQGLATPLTQREYAAALSGLIHSSPNQLVRPNRAAVELVFTHARLGQTVRYKILREWIQKGSTVEEGLRIFVDQSSAPFLVDEQAQAFLSQLIPFGISQFFFFDGEQIAALANDDSDQVLGDAVRRLLGLDIADRLNSDLSVFIRGKRAAAAGDDAGSRLRELQATYDQLKNDVDEAQNDLQTNLQPQLDAAILAKESMRSRLSENGGAWAINRAEVEAALDALKQEKFAVEDQVRELLGGMAVFSFAPSLCDQLSETVKAERDVLDARAAAAAVNANVQQLKKRLAEIRGSSTWRPVALRCIDDWLSELVPTNVPKQKFVHGLTGSEADKLLQALSHVIPGAGEQLKAATDQIQKLSESELILQDKLAHAPSDSSIQDAFSRLEEAVQKVAQLEAKKQALLEEIRRKLWIAIDVTRKKRKLERESKEGGVSSKAEHLAEGVRNVIADFQARSAQHKCEELRKHFMAAFGRLARKDDMITNARIDPSNFSIKLFGAGGEEVAKSRLSAGEKQIFAIAMLEALGKTSGRSLPIIIDTPLGRLDSTHRERLIESYFPKASHQVIILSTDTEVDQRFYDGLRSKVSHAFHLKFDPALRSTTVEEGYFWKAKEALHVA
jgi:DNA sulfur modification protein DndD